MRSYFFRHVVNVAAPAAALVMLTGLARLAAAVFLFFALFNWMHDAMHASLGLSRRANRVLLSVLAASIGVSGEASRYFHLLHHGRPFSSEDLEGRGVDWPWTRLVLHAPLAYLSLPWLGWSRAPKRGRRVQLVEWIAVAAWFAICACFAPLRVYLAVLLPAQLTIPLWGAKLPHRPPRWMLAVARTLLFTKSPLAIGFALHEEHHARAKIASFALADLELRTLHADTSAARLRSAPLGVSGVVESL